MEQSTIKTTKNKIQYYPVVQLLKEILDKDIIMRTTLLASLEVAVARAKKDINSDLYAAIDKVFDGKGWPRTIEAYLDYLDMYVRLVPNEENDPQYPNAWKSDDTKNGYNQKVFDLLCQFYWLVDQKVEGKSMQSFKKFAEWLEAFAAAWGEFLDTEESLTPETLASFKRDTMYNFHLYAEHERSWKTFNEFFYRQFNHADKVTGISPLRPISAPNNNENIVAAADCTFVQNYAINENGDVVDESRNPTKIKLKHTHSIGNVKELLDGSEYADDFNNGTFVHYFLNPFDYHRFHSSVNGEVLEIKNIHGRVYLDVVPTGDGQWDAPDSAEDGYEFKQARGLIIVDTKSDVGKVAILPIGMAQVSGVDMYINSIKPNDTIVKGQEFGKFKFGGSDIILLFEKNPHLYLFKKDPSHNPIHFQYGQTIAYWNVEDNQ